MARGAEAKLRRRNRKKNGAEEFADEHFGDDDDAAPAANGKAKRDIPLPPGMLMDLTDAPIDQSTDDDVPESTENLPKKKKKKKSKPPGVADETKTARAPTPGGKPKEGIKMLPLIFLVLMTATTMIPVMIFASDYVGAYASKSNLFGKIGFTLGIGQVPRKRVMSFYEKHDPNKLEEVPSILSKHYGSYPKLVKRLERKYQDYGYFLGWEDDEAAVKLAMEQLKATYDTWLQGYWNVYAPQPLKTGARNIRYNVTFLFKRGKKIWKKHVWPLLEPVFGVPKGGDKQKRKDKEDARKQRPGAPKGTKRKNKDFRDEEDEE
jgi:hypothetical protein